MGNAQGGPGADNGDEGEHMGYRVLGVQAGSPAASAGLVSFFDFIIEANNQPLKVRHEKCTYLSAHLDAQVR
jgi:hypothetical protein